MHIEFPKYEKPGLE